MNTWDPPRWRLPRSRRPRSRKMPKLDRLRQLTGGRCHYCGERIRRAETTADHVVPKSKGGVSQLHNLVACCQACNHAKGAMDYEEFRLTMFGGAMFWGEQVQEGEAAD